MKLSSNSIFVKNQPTLVELTIFYEENIYKENKEHELFLHFTMFASKNNCLLDIIAQSERLILSEWKKEIYLFCVFSISEMAVLSLFLGETFAAFTENYFPLIKREFFSKNIFLLHTQKRKSREWKEIIEQCNKFKDQKKMEDLW